MKCKVLAVLISISVTIMLTGCGESAVKCDDSDAQKLVMDIVEEETKNQLTGDSRVSYAQIKQAGTTERIDRIDKEYKDLNLKLTNIRIESMDDKLIKSECAAQILFESGYTVDITYKLSKTTDGSLFAEVSGLQ